MEAIAIESEARSETGPCRELWLAALVRYIHDVRSPKLDQGEALADYQGKQRILRYLAEQAGYDHCALSRLT